MNGYSFPAAVFIGSDGTQAALNDVALDFKQGPRLREANLLDDWKLEVTGRVSSFTGQISGHGKIVLETFVMGIGDIPGRKLTITLNNCVFFGSVFHALEDDDGNIFTLTSGE